VEVLPSVDHSERSEAQLHEGDRVLSGDFERYCRECQRMQVRWAVELNRGCEKNWFDGVSIRASGREAARLSSSGFGGVDLAIVQ
jgi:hypothetical protein